MKILLSWRFLVVVLLVVISLIISGADGRNSDYWARALSSLAWLVACSMFLSSGSNHRLKLFVFSLSFLLLVCIWILCFISIAHSSGHNYDPAISKLNIALIVTFIVQSVVSFFVNDVT